MAFLHLSLKVPSPPGPRAVAPSQQDKLSHAAPTGTPWDAGPGSRPLGLELCPRNEVGEGIRRPPQSQGSILSFRS